MVSVGSQPDVSVGAHSEKGRAPDTEEISRGGFQAPDTVGQVGARAEGEGSFEHDRAGGEILKGREQRGELRTSCGWTAEQHQSMAGTVSEFTKWTAHPVPWLHRYRVGKTLPRAGITVGVADDD